MMSTSTTTTRAGRPNYFSGSYADLTNKPTIPASQVNSDWTSGSGLSSILNKPSLFDGAYSSLTGAPSLATVATSGAYSDLTGKPTIQAIQRTRVQTNSSGAYTWTFPVAYGAGVIPIISLDIEDGSAAIWNSQLTAVSNTSATIQLAKSTAVTILGISVLGVAATPQAYVHLTAVAP